MLTFSFGAGTDRIDAVQQACVPGASPGRDSIECEYRINRLIGSGEDPEQVVRVLEAALLYIPPLSPTGVFTARMHAQTALFLSTMGHYDIPGSVSAFAQAILRYGSDADEEETLINSLRGILISIPELAKTLIDPISKQLTLSHPDITAQAIIAVKEMAEAGPTPAVRQFAREMMPELSALQPIVGIPVPPGPTPTTPTPTPTPPKKKKPPVGPLMLAFGLFVGVGALIFYADSVSDRY